MSDLIAEYGDEAIYEEFVGICTCEHEKNDHSYSGCEATIHGDYEFPCHCKAHWEGDD